MPKITGVDTTNITKRSGVSSLSKVTGVSLSLGASGQPANGYSGLASSGMIMRLDAADSNSYNAPGDTTWSDLSGNSKDLTLVNGPTEPSAGDNYVNFDGVNDYGTLTWVSGDHFYVNDTLSNNNAPIPAFTATAVFSFPEDPNNAGYIPSDSFVRFGSRRQSGGLRALQIDFSHRGIQMGLAYGTNPRINWPSTPTADFQYNSATSQYQPKPNRVLFAAITVAPGTSAQMVGYLNGATFTPQSVVGSVSNVSGSTIGTVTYLSNAAVDLGPDTWIFGVGQTSTGALASNHLASNVYEYVLYDRALSASEIQSNYNAYVAEYGALN